MLVAACLTGRAAVADERAAMRIGEHPGFGRIVFDLPDGAGANVVTEDGRVLIVFRDVAPPLPPPLLPRNVKRLDPAASSMTLTLAPGAVLRQAWLGNRLVIDVMDAPGRSAPALPAARPPMREAGAPPRPRTPPATLAPAGNAPPAAGVPKADPTAPQPARAEPPTDPAPTILPPPHGLPEPPAEPVQAGVTRRDAAPNLGTIAPDAPKDQTAVSAAATQDGAENGQAAGFGAPFLVPAAVDVGAAVIPRGGSVLFVLDQRLPVPPAPQGTQWIPGAVSMTLQVPARVGMTLQARRTGGGWLLSSGGAATAGAAAVAPGSDGLNFSLPRPGRSLVVLDPVGGGPVLVGTSLADDGGSAVAERRQTPDYVVLKTALGVAVEPSSDRVDLRATPTGFALSGAPAPVPADSADRLTRRFDIPEGSVSELGNRLRSQLVGAAGSAARSRSRERMAAARTMIALGMDLEAGALLRLVAEEDPQEAAAPDLGALADIAAVLAGQPAVSPGLADDRLGQSDELAFWRALRLVRSDPQAAPIEAARTLARLADVAWRYPAPLRDAVWSDVAEAAVTTGTAVPKGRLTPFAEALALERAGQVDAALAAYDGLVAGQDALLRRRAGRRGVELRLLAGRIAPSTAADVLDRLALGWRGDGHEAALRERAAVLRGLAGDWKVALDALGEIDRQFPDRHAAIQADTGTVLQAMLDAQGGSMSPLNLVLLAAEYGDRLPSGPAGMALARLLADKLMALDLPARAIPVLQGLMRAAPAGEMRVEFGARLAQLLLDGGDAAGAAAALDGSGEQGVPTALAERRALLRARAQAGLGDLAGAVSGLVSQGSAGADELRASLLEAAKDWPGAEGALADLRAKVVPPEGALTDAQQAIVLREASAASQVPDRAGLQKLAGYVPRVTGARVDLLRMLTAAPLSTPTDLPRAGRELALARVIPRRIEALSAP